MRQEAESGKLHQKVGLEKWHQKVESGKLHQEVESGNYRTTDNMVNISKTGMQWNGIKGNKK